MLNYFSNAPLAVLFALVAEKKDLKLTPEAMAKMLRLNSDLDRVKIGVDDDGDAFVRIDASIRILDTDEFKALIEQTAAAADEVFAALKPFLAAPKKPGN
jgi:hypothetical protein